MKSKTTYKSAEVKRHIAALIHGLSCTQMPEDNAEDVPIPIFNGKNIDFAIDLLKSQNLTAFWWMGKYLAYVRC